MCKTNRIFSLFVVFIFIFSFSISSGDVPSGNFKDQGSLLKGDVKAGSLKPDINFGNIPLYFTHNKGQLDKRALFYAKTPGYTLWVTKGGLIFDSIGNKKTDIRSKKPEVKSQNKVETSFRDVSRLLFVGANKNIEITPLKEQKHKVNYFKGNDKSKWVKNVPTSGAVLYKNVYKNIDLKVYGIGKQIEYDWIVHPGGNTDDIKFEYKSVKAIKINKKGDLNITTQFGNLIHKKPFTYQNTLGVNGNSPKEEIKSSFKKISKNTFGFFTGKYDKTKPLVIDPVVLIYSTYLGGESGGSGSSDIEVDSSGCVYVTGVTDSPNFPTTPGSFQTIKGTSYDAFVTKFSADGSSLVYSTFIGGDNRDWGSGIAIDHYGAAYITGATESADFPMEKALYNTYMGGGGDVFVTKISPAGDSLEYSTFLGGVATDRGEGIDVDSYGYAYITGYTLSADFPVHNQFQSDQGSTDAFVSKLTFIAGNLNLAYSTYFGGFGDDRASGISVENEALVFITGYTATNTGFPLKNALQDTFGGGNRDLFIARFNSSQSGSDSLVWSTYFGGDGNDEDPSICLDYGTRPHVIFTTNSSDLPVSTGAFQTSIRGGRDYFIARFNGGGSIPSLLSSTYLGGSGDEGDEDRAGIAIDYNYSVYVTGFTQSADFPVLGQLQNYSGSGTDALVTKFSGSDLGSLEYSTYLGGSGADYGAGIAVDPWGEMVYVTGITNSDDFPLVNEYQGYPEWGWGSAAFVTKLFFVPEDSVNNYTVMVSPGEGGSVEKEKHVVTEGGSAIINIYPEEGYEIERIVDNGIEMAVSNPYVIKDIQEDHTVEITFKKILYPPVLSLTGVKKIEKAWIVQKGYSELKISITENESPMVVSAYVLYKNVSGVWSEIKSYSGPGSYEYTDKYFKKGESVDYKLAAIAPDGTIVTEKKLSL